jgi:CheY-like chemotaxis protein
MNNDNGNTRTRPYSILIADDAPATRDALRVLLEERGYHVTVAADGGEALDLLAKLDPAPDLMIVDLNMPNVDGFALRDAQKKRKELAHVPVIALTGHPALRQHAVRSGFTAALQKPFDAGMLLSLLAHHCRGLTSGRAA